MLIHMGFARLTSRQDSSIGSDRRVLRRGAVLYITPLKHAIVFDASVHTASGIVSWSFLGAVPLCGGCSL